MLMHARMASLRSTSSAAGDGITTGLVWVNAIAQSTDLNEYTFSAQSLGTEAATRHIVLAQLNDGGVPDTVTIGGVSASQVGSSDFFIANVPLGTIGDIVVTYGGLPRSRCHIGFWRFYTPSLDVASSASVAADNALISIDPGSTAVWATANNSGSDQTHSIDNGFLEQAELFAEQNSAYAQLVSVGGLLGTVTSTWSGAGTTRVTYVILNP